MCVTTQRLQCSPRHPLSGKAASSDNIAIMALNAAMILPASVSLHPSTPLSSASKASPMLPATAPSVMQKPKAIPEIVPGRRTTITTTTTTISPNGTEHVTTTTEKSSSELSGSGATRLPREGSKDQSSSPTTPNGSFGPSSHSGPQAGEGPRLVRSQMSDVYVVATIADAEALSKTGYFRGMPIEVEGLGLYNTLKGKVSSNPTSRVATTGHAVAEGMKRSTSLDSKEPRRNSTGSEFPVHTPPPPGPRRSSVALPQMRDLGAPHPTAAVPRDVTPRNRPPSGRAGAVAQPLPASPSQRPLFNESTFKRVYDATQAPEYPHQLLEALHTLIFHYASLRGIDRAKADAFFRELQETAFVHVEELLSDIQSAAGRIWTSPKRMEEREFCFILNEVIREDIEEPMRHAVCITRAINLLLVCDAAKKPRAVSMVYRGGGLPDEHRAFFTLKKTYRVPMFLATSVCRETSQDRFCRRAEVKNQLPPVLWIIQLDERGCKHVNYLHTTECEGEQEYLFVPYSVFTVEKVEWRDKPTWKDPHLVYLSAAYDNRAFPEGLPLAPWA
jgi:hypothetical protein